MKNGFRIYKTTDILEYKIKSEDGELSVFISPLSLAQRSRLQSIMSKAVDGDLQAATQATILAFKMGLKKVKGIVCSDEEGKDIPYVLEIVDGELTDNCVDDLLNMPISNKMGAIIGSLITGVNDLKGQDGKALEGISFLGVSKPKK